MAKTPTLPRRFCGLFYDRIPDGIGLQRVPKPREDVTQSDIRFLEQQSRDWMFYCFSIGATVKWLAENLRCDAQDIKQAIESVIRGELRYNTHPHALFVEKDWPENADLILRKCKQAGRSLEDTAALLSRPQEEVRARFKELNKGTSNG